jgi:hypothetical protein
VRLMLCCVAVRARNRNGRLSLWRCRSAGAFGGDSRVLFERVEMGFCATHQAGRSVHVTSAVRCHFAVVRKKYLHTDCIRMALHQRKRTHDPSS